MRYLIVCAFISIACAAIQTAAMSAVPAAPRLVVEGVPSYRLAQSCPAGEPAVEFVINVHNAGGAISPASADAHAIQVADGSLAGWTAGVPLPALAPGASLPVTVDLPPFSAPDAMSGTHHFSITLNRTSAGSIAVTFPPRFCNRAQISASRPARPQLLPPRLIPPVATPQPKTIPHSTVGATNVYRPPMFLAAPSSVQTTTSLDDCTNHAGSFGCAFAIQSHYYIVIWSWSNAPCPADASCPPSVDGYHLYGDGKLVGSVRGAATGLAVDPRQVGTPCFTVTAYQGSTESKPSGQRCVSSGNATAGVQTQTFAALHLQSVERVQGTGKMSTQPLNLYKPGLLEVGFKYLTFKDSLGDSSNNFADRGAVLFDLRALAGRSIQSATLHLHVASSTIGSTYETNSYTNCIAKIGTGQGDWWDRTTWFDGNWFATQGLSDGPDFSTDVTAAVRGWSAGRPNYGFIFQGSEENLNAFTENACQSNYSSPSLEVQFISTQ